MVTLGAYVSATDPGAVGTGRFWLDTSIVPNLVWVRNAMNTGWDKLCTDCSPTSIQYCATTPGSGVSASSIGYSGVGPAWVVGQEGYRGVFIGAPSIVIDLFSIVGYNASNYALFDIGYSWDGGAITFSPIYAQLTPNGGFTGQVCWNGPGGISYCQGSEGGLPDTTPTTFGHPSPPNPATLRLFGCRAQQNDNVGDATFCVSIGHVTDTGTGLVVPNLV